MNVYPAIKGRMGEWEYYLVKMTMKHVADEIVFAQDIEEDGDKTLSQAIQRKLNDSRLKNGLVDFLAKRDDRFFASLVVAARGGNPRFYTVTLSDDERFEILVGQNMDDHFGVLTFTGQEYYALDGQHRLKAIKLLLGKEQIPRYEPPPAPAGFDKEEISVLLLTLPDDVPETEFLEKHRRLFASLNRHAKPTSVTDNIIIDEDDAIAIITRRLIHEHPFFRWVGNERDSPRIKTDGSKNLTQTETHFCHLISLYDINWILLDNRNRSGNWRDPQDPDSKSQPIKQFINFRPSEEFLDQLYQELTIYWDGILQAFPDLYNEPYKMRNHSVDPSDPDDDTRDHLLFWTIGLEMFARVVSELLDEYLPSSEFNKDDVVEALESLTNIPWDLQEAPWKYLVLIQSLRGGWIMRSEERSATMTFCRHLLAWIVGLDSLDEDGRRELKIEWRSRLVNPDPSYIEEAWETIENLRQANL